MVPSNHSNLSKKAEHDAATNADTAIGIIVGFCVSPVTAIWGGYELGSFVNNHVHNMNHLARGAVDAVAMGGVGYLTILGGFAAGTAMGAVSYHVIEDAKCLGAIVSKGYNRVGKDATDLWKIVSREYKIRRK